MLCAPSRFSKVHHLTLAQQQEAIKDVENLQGDRGRDMQQLAVTSCFKVDECVALCVCIGNMLFIMLFIVKGPMPHWPWRLGRTAWWM